MPDELHLRPTREDDLAIIETLTQDPETTGEFAWFGWHHPLRWRRWAEDRLLDDASGVLMAVLGSRPLGFTAEGICRGVGGRDGQWRDGVT